MKKKNTWFLSLFLILFAAFHIFLIFSFDAEKEKAVESFSQKVIRLHILANSNSKQDQKLKLLVRDEIVTYITKESKGIKTKEDARQFLQSHNTQLEAIANDVLIKHGADYLASGYLTRCSFPVRTYGNASFPAGEYDAYRMLLGNGSGHNWWCVLYPPLCFLEESASVPTTTADPSIQEPKEYKIQFRFLTFLNELF